MTLTIHANGKEDTSALYISQEGYQHGAEWDWYYDAVKQTWPGLVQTLKSILKDEKFEVKCPNRIYPSSDCRTLQNREALILKGRHSKEDQMKKSFLRLVAGRYDLLIKGI